jgi:hypothetical protein
MNKNDGCQLSISKAFDVIKILIFKKGTVLPELTVQILDNRRPDFNLVQQFDTVSPLVSIPATDFKELCKTIKLSKIEMVELIVSNNYLQFQSEASSSQGLVKRFENTQVFVSRDVNGAPIYFRAVKP